MSKSSWLWPGSEDKVPLTLSDATSGVGDEQRLEQGRDADLRLSSCRLVEINLNSNISEL